MASTQELIVEEEAIEPPRQMIASPRYFMNRSLHKIAVLVAEQAFAGILAESNNSGGSCATKDVKEFKGFVSALKGEVAFLKDVFTAKDGYDPAPDGLLDTQLAVLMPGSYEKNRYRNSCWKAPHLALFNLLDVLSSHPDIELQSEVKDWALVDRAVAAVDKSVEYYFGGKVVYPSRQKLKNLNPPADFNYEKSFEPSADNPVTGFADQADVAISKR